MTIFGEEIIEHDGAFSTVAVFHDMAGGGLALHILDPADRACGCLILAPTAAGYEVRLERGGEVQRLPFLDWSESDDRRLGEVLPAYRRALSVRSYYLLAQPRFCRLRLAAFLQLLRQAVAYDAGDQAAAAGRRLKLASLYRLGRGIGPKTVEELAGIFLAEEERP